MNRQQKSLLLSVSLHGILLASMYAMSSSSARIDPPIVVDFSVSSAEGPVAGHEEAAAGTRAPGAAVRRRSAPGKSSPAPPFEPQKAQPAAAEQTPETPVEKTGPAAVFVRPKTEAVIAAKNEAAWSPAAAISKADSPASGNYDSSPRGGATSRTAPESVGMPAERLRESYLKENFAYINDLIQRNISYPARARRKGWSGKVVVSFIINETGGISDVRVVASSGFDLLDNNVIAAIRAVAPFTPPPVKAELHIPVSYRLE